MLLNLFMGLGLPSVSTTITLGLSDRSPPATVNSSSLAFLSAKSVRVSPGFGSRECPGSVYLAGSLDIFALGRSSRSTVSRQI